MVQDQRYQILHLIEKGGMAEVFHALAESGPLGFKRHVAIKRILPTLSQNPKFVSMFLDEARLSFHLRHANIVQVTDIGQPEQPNEWGERPYFLVMEYVEGTNLKNILDDQKEKKQILPISYSIYIMMEICKALAYAHELTDPETHVPFQIIHRDISPPNILLSKKGEVKLTDFGLARAASQVEKTEPGMVKGKFSYLSPEIALGLPIDQRSDLFSVGIVLYELLTNEKLFDGPSDYSVLEQVQKCQIPSLIAKNPAIPPAVESMVKKLLSLDPAQRYQHASAVVDSFAHYLFQQGQQITNRHLEKLLAEFETKNSQVPIQSLRQWGNVLIQEELQKFTSLEELDSEKQPNLVPKSNNSQEALVDPRDWNMGLLTSASVFVALPQKTHSSMPVEKMASTPEPKTLLVAPAPESKPVDSNPVLPSKKTSTSKLSRQTMIWIVTLSIYFILFITLILVFSTPIAAFFCNHFGVFCG